MMITRMTWRLQESDTEKPVTLYILDDPYPEDDEYIFVYLRTLTDGARVAQPSTDGGRKVRGYICLSPRVK